MLRVLTIRTVCGRTGELKTPSFYGTLESARKYVLDTYNSTFTSVSVFEGNFMHFGLMGNAIWSPSDPDPLTGFACAYMCGACPSRVESNGDSCARHQFAVSTKPVRTCIAGIPYKPCAEHGCFTGRDYGDCYCRRHKKVEDRLSLRWPIVGGYDSD